MYMAVKEFNIRFIDSIDFVSGALATLPKTFGFSELKKGYFPHLFNIPGNQNYVGSIPAKHYYDPDHMKPNCNNRSKFLKWYDERVEENYVFDFQKELRMYCPSDVDILRRSMMTFRDDFLKIGIRDLKQATFLSTRTAAGRNLPRYRWRMVASAVLD